MAPPHRWEGFSERSADSGYIGARTRREDFFLCAKGVVALDARARKE
jgi:hypothetical protein